MAIYTGVADANGDFNIPFSTNYTGGQKVTVTAEKDSATKTIELHAPSEVIGAGGISFSGSFNNFPTNIGVITLSGFTGELAYGAFEAGNYSGNIFRCATGLIIGSGITALADYSFNGWPSATSLTLPDGLLTIGTSAFNYWNSLKSIKIPASVTNIGDYAFYSASMCTSLEILSTSLQIGSYAFANCSNLRNIKMHATTPPKLLTDVFQSLPSNCSIKVPQSSVAAYKAASGWKTHSSKISGY